MATIIPTMAATIERRLLVNYRVDPASLASSSRRGCARS